MMPMQRPDPKVIQKTIEIVTKRKEALSRLIAAGTECRFQLFETQDPADPLVQAIAGFIEAYAELQRLELIGAEAYLNDLEQALQQAESPILQAHMHPRGRG